MELAHPTALLWALLGIPVALLYTLRIVRRQVPVPTILLWEQVLPESEYRAIWQRLRHFVSLLMQLLFLLLLVLALADFSFHPRAARPRGVVLVIDNSASMNANDAAGTRLARAKAEAERMILGLGPRDQAAIVTAGTHPMIRCGLTTYRQTLKDAVRQVPATDGPTQIAAAADLARRILAGHNDSRVIVLTDGCFPEVDELTKQQDIEWHVLGRRSGNVGITQFQARRSLLDPIGYELLVEVSNFSDEKVACELRVDLDGSVMDVVPLELAAGGTWKTVMEQTSAEGGRVVAQLDTLDACNADNQSFAVLPASLAQPVTLVTDGDQFGDWFLERVFSANPVVELTVTADLPSDASIEVHSSPLHEGANAEQAHVIVFHRKIPEQLPPGSVFVIDPANSFDLCEVGDPIEDPFADVHDDNSPLMAHLNFSEFPLRGARRLALHTEATVLASTIEGAPLYCAVDRPQGRVLIMTASLDRSDLPLRTAFPILVANALSWLTSNEGQLVEALSAGSVAQIDVSSVPTDQQDLALFSPDGARRPLPIHDGRATVGPLGTCGVWTIRYTSREDPSDRDGTKPPVLDIPCNLSNRIESDLRPPQHLLNSRQGAGEPESQGRSVWFYCLVAAALFTGAEWYLYQRRLIS